MSLLVTRHESFWGWLDDDSAVGIERNLTGVAHQQGPGNGLSFNPGDFSSTASNTQELPGEGGPLAQWADRLSKERFLYSGGGGDLVLVPLKRLPYYRFWKLLEGGVSTGQEVRKGDARSLHSSRVAAQEENFQRSWPAAAVGAHSGAAYNGRGNAHQARLSPG